MKPRNYVILMVVCIVAMVLTASAPCGAQWQYVGSYVPNNPKYDSGGDAYSHWEYSFSESTSADSGGVSASGTCNASTWVSIYVWEGGIEQMSRSPYAACSTYGYSYYARGPIPQTLHVSWSVSGGGSVDCSGNVEDRYCDGSTDASSSADGGTDADDGYGYGSAWGSAWTALALGSADVDWGGYAEEDSSSVYEGYGSYSASLSFGVEGSDGWADDTLTSFTASASVYASSSSSGSASLTEGDAYASCDSSASCSGSSSTSVSW